MKLIGDCGGTSCDWAYISNDGGVKYIQSNGFNPTIQGTSVLKKHLDLINVGRVREVFIYAAGLTAEFDRSDIQAVVQQQYGIVEESIRLHSDLLAACHAMCGESSGVVGILGTGANACYYDGQDIEQSVMPIGFALGDDGSGADLGRRLLRAYFYNQLSKKLQGRLEGFTNMGRERVLDEVYKGENPNTYLASFVPFIVENQDELELTGLIHRSLSDYTRYFIQPYSNRSAHIGIVGGVGNQFKARMEVLLRSLGFSGLDFEEQPIKRLVAYHK